MSAQSKTDIVAHFNCAAQMFDQVGASLRAALEQMEGDKHTDKHALVKLASYLCCDWANFVGCIAEEIERDGIRE
jgi:hypothetical protein